MVRLDLAMQSISEIIANELSDADREILGADRARWERLGAGGHLEDWLAFAPGLTLRRNLAMKLAHTNDISSKKYRDQFSAILRDGGFDTTDKSLKNALSAVLWLHDDPERLSILAAIRADKSPGQHARFNSPTTAQQAVKKELKKRSGNGVDQDEGKPLRQTLNEQISELKKQVDELKRHGGSLCDFKLTPAEGIARSMAPFMGEEKANKIHDELLKLIRARKAKGLKLEKGPAPAG